ncbi:hypothetical protein Pint_19534 [Pistacia integerrima]|uniref:Uncharacterized protein n=1 Tax=Pistacia integerrima TaxID=434235 RepID=A0ACC0X8B7_9ROSI|nr:hypothetical protein Pint_19534 [Pistacia integerrima]
MVSHVKHGDPYKQGEKTFNFISQNYNKTTNLPILPNSGLC